MSHASQLSSKPIITQPVPQTNWNSVVILVGVGIGVVIITSVTLLWFLSGQAVSGEEFCPQTFQYRTFYYRRVPRINKIVSATILSPQSLPVSSAVLQHVQRLPGERWDVVTVTEGFRSEVRSPKILIDALTCTTSSGTFWDAWSKEHPELAKLTWPLVQRAALADSYDLIPTILEQALEISQESEPSINAKSFADRWSDKLDR
ncbi:hypothetical protein SH449x_001165 [Pirellulaceae bacterium SH449]